MDNESTTTNTSDINKQQLKQLLLDGNFQEAEKIVFASMREAGAKYVAELIEETSESNEGKAIVNRLSKDHNYRTSYKTSIQITLIGEQHINIMSTYALAPRKKSGRPKAGRNGTGTHVLLAYWGFLGKRSPGSISEIARCGAAGSSYEAASEQLRSQGVNVSARCVNNITKSVGAIASLHRSKDHLALENSLSLKDKRVAISLDGGRIRSRVTKTGRRKKGQKRQGYVADWKEPKLLVIAELDEIGKKQKNTKPIYEATMQGKEEFTRLLISLCQQLHLSEAAEIVCLGDGAPVLWDIFASLQKKLRIKGKTTEIVDFFHACEHITELTQLHTKKTAKQQQEWAKELRDLLRAGKFITFIASIKKQAKEHDLPEIVKHLGYFKRHKERMHYDQYEKAHLPVGSGIVESAIRRVINGRLKAPGSFWKLENVELILTVRCALVAGRWNTFMDNFLRVVRIGFIGAE
jgi:hypothetical protein